MTTDRIKADRALAQIEGIRLQCVAVKTALQIIAGDCDSDELRDTIKYMDDVLSDIDTVAEVLR